MTDYPYDPEFPYVVTAGFGFPYARFHREEEAWLAAEKMDTRVLDTTPKPKIPEDAQFITWREKATGSTAVAYLEKGLGSPFWVYIDSEVSKDELLEQIGDAEVTVLVPKEDNDG